MGRGLKRVHRSNTARSPRSLTPRRKVSRDKNRFLSPKTRKTTKRRSYSRLALAHLDALTSTPISREAVAERVPTNTIPNPPNPTSQGPTPLPPTNSAPENLTTHVDSRPFQSTT
jgi:hypothetical protein